MNDRIRLFRGDITKLAVDAVVNAANESLLGWRWRRTLGGCETGQAKLTRDYRLLPAHWIIHTVGPVWDGGARGEHDLLASCYRASLALAAPPGFRSLRIAVQEIRAFFEKNANPDQVTLVWLDQRVYAAHAKLLGASAARAPAAAGHFFRSGCSAWTLLLA